MKGPFRAMSVIPSDFPEKVMSASRGDVVDLVRLPTSAVSGRDMGGLERGLCGVVATILVRDQAVLDIFRRRLCVTASVRAPCCDRKATTGSGGRGKPNRCRVYYVRG